MLRKLKKKIKGFTLIELLSVIIILIIILLIAVPQVLKIMVNIKQRAYNAEVVLINKATSAYLANN